MNTYWVYIMTSPSKTLYVGMTSDLARRVHEHKNRLVRGFTSRYSFPFLAYYESTTDVHAAIAHEKRIKAWRREKKVALIEAMNPQWRDLSRDWTAAPGKTPRPPDYVGIVTRGDKRAGDAFER